MRLKQARRARGMTQVDLATASRVGLSVIRQIEQTDFEPRLATLRRLAATLDVRLEWLLFGSGGTEESHDDAKDGERA
jgi:transcriptional regulator with XRE-family HTH domain